MVFHEIEKRIEKVSKLMDLKEKEKDVLMQFASIQKADLNVNGKKYYAFRIIHSNALGPGKGGIRFHPNVNEDEVKSLAFWMSLKNSLVGLPYGGAKGGVRVNPKELNEQEIEELSREFVRAFYKTMGQDKDIPAPDVYTNSKIMGYMLDEFETLINKKEPGFITGKPLSLGGCVLRNDATSKGGFIVLNQLIKKSKLDRDKIKVVIQGFGNAGSYIAKMLFDNNIKVIGVSDSKGGIYNEKGLNIEEVMKIKKETRNVVNYADKSEAEKITNKELLKLDTDILILAALENQITKENADNIKAKYILELANGPTTAEADIILNENNVLVVPDILANAGGVTVSYFEWVQNRTGHIFDIDYFEEKLNRIMTNAFNKVFDLANKKEISLREAAYILAIQRILEAEKARGHI